MTAHDRRRRRSPALACVVVAACIALAVGGPPAAWPVPPIAIAQERPFPDQDAFLAEVRTHLQTDQALQSSYAYVETRREQKIDGKGRPTGESVKVFENSPGLPGERRWERLIEEDGMPVPAGELARQDRDRQKKAQEIARRMDREPRKEHARQLRAWEEYQRETAATVDDIFRVFDIRPVGREIIDGHDTIAFRLTPRRDAKPRTRDGGMMRRFVVNAWVSERDYELVRLHAEATGTVSIGFGLLARIHKGARFAFERRQVNGEVWLPSTYSYSGTARVGLLKTIRRAGSSEFSHYRKFTVETSSQHATPVVESR
jgi:hypothetical protein